MRSVVDSGWAASIVVPAHNEEAVIGRCLASIAEQESSDELEVIVVANGCTDATVDVARSYSSRLPGLDVIDRAEPGKAAALNSGDVRATAAPHVYLDADVELEPGALDNLVRALSVDRAVVACPRVRFDTSRASPSVRAFYRAFTCLPYATDGLIGLGVYGVSAAGRKRFEAFPKLTGDDLFVQRLFGADERLTSSGYFVVRTPRNLDALVRVRARVAFGNAELTAQNPLQSVDSASTTSTTFRALTGLVVRQPWRVVDAAVYVGVILRARLLARRAAGHLWHRDETSRV